jgi:hypothetical protein
MCVGLWASEIWPLFVKMNTMPRVVVEANNYASSIEYSLVVVTEGKECKSFLVSVVDLVDTGYM